MLQHWVYILWVLAKHIYGLLQHIWDQEEYELDSNVPLLPSGAFVMEVSIWLIIHSGTLVQSKFDMSPLNI